MDFLDPRKRRYHTIRLFIGYFLVGIAIILATVILVYAAQGYGINTKTGKVIQNGLLFVDSKPGSANIYLNGKLQSSKTAARLVVPAGNYQLSLSKDGYRSWNRNFEIDASATDRYVYPFLFPTKPATFKIKNYTGLPNLVTETPDRHWLLVQSPESTQGNLVFDQYDTGNLAKEPTQVTLPSSVVTAADDSTYKVVEWSTNNDQVLLQHTYPGDDEFIVFNRSKPDQSFNVNKMFNMDPTSVALKNKKADQLYVYNQAGGTLQIGDTGAGTLASPLLKNVADFKPYGDSIVLYVTTIGVANGQAQARILDGTKNYQLYTFAAGTSYLIDLAQFQSDWYYVAGSNDSSRIDIFKNPESYIANPKYKKAVPLIDLPDPGATVVSFSDNTRFIGAENGQSFAVYDLETQAGYRYQLNYPLTAGATWMDGHRFMGQSDGKVLAFDYDNTNIVHVTDSLLSGGGYFNQDYNQLMTFVPASDGSGVTLMRVDMRAGSDLPKNGAQ